MKPDPRSTRGKRSQPSEISPPEPRRSAPTKRQAASSQGGGIPKVVRPRAKTQSRTASGAAATAIAPRSRALSTRKRAISATVCKNKVHEDEDKTKAQDDNDDLANSHNDDEAETAPSTARTKRRQQPKPESKNVANKKPRTASARSTAPKAAPTTVTTRKRATDTPASSSETKRPRSATPATTQVVTSPRAATRTVRAPMIRAQVAPLPTISEPTEDTEVEPRSDDDGSASSASNAMVATEQEESSEMDTFAIDNQQENESDAGTETDTDVAERVSRYRRASGQNKDPEYAEYSPREVAASQALFSLQQQTSQVHCYQPQYGSQSGYYHQDPRHHQHGDRHQGQEYDYRHSAQNSNLQPVPYQCQQQYSPQQSSYSESSRQYVHDHPHVHRHRHRHLHCRRPHHPHHPYRERRSSSPSKAAYPPDQRYDQSQIHYSAPYTARNQSKDSRRTEQPPQQSNRCTKAIHQSIYDWGFRDGMMTAGVDPDGHSTHQQQRQSHKSDQNQEQPQQIQHDGMQTAESNRDSQSTDRSQQEQPQQEQPQPEQRGQEKEQEEQQEQKVQTEEQEEQDRSCTPTHPEGDSDAGQPSVRLPISPLVDPKPRAPLGEAPPVTQADIPEPQSPSWATLAPIGLETQDRTQMLPGPADIEAALVGHIPLPRSPFPTPSPSCRPSSPTDDQ